MFRIEALGARHGDCLLLHYGGSGREWRVLVDGGPRGVYAEFLRPRLEELGSAAGAGRPVEIELGIVSHIDDDHIAGLLDLTDELLDSGAGGPPLVSFRRFWHNSFEALAGGGTAETSAILAAADAGAATGNAAAAGPGCDGRGGQILASVRQGRRLADNLVRLGLSGNLPFDGPVSAATDNGGGSADVILDGGLELTVIGPPANRLAALKRTFQAGVAAAEIAAFTDRSVANLASIVLLARHGGRTALLTGDARGDDVLAGLETRGLLAPGGVLPVDLHKVTHHGSDRNVTTEFFRRLPAATYLISADGHHDNPEPETLAMIGEARAGESGRRIVMASPITRMDAAKKAKFDRELAALERAGVRIEIRSSGALSIPVDV